jgi:hypothetical protein
MIRPIQVTRWLIAPPTVEPAAPSADPQEELAQAVREPTLDAKGRVTGTVKRQLLEASGTELASPCRGCRRGHGASPHLDSMSLRRRQTEFRLIGGKMSRPGQRLRPSVSAPRWRCPMEG